ncbi:hypothetical protein SARC_10449, partial [Sphaeroforma arctica JP610]
VQVVDDSSAKCQAQLQQHDKQQQAQQLQLQQEVQSLRQQLLQQQQHAQQILQMTPGQPTCDRHGCIRPEYEEYHGGQFKPGSMLYGGGIQYPTDICKQAHDNEPRMTLMMASEIQTLFRSYLNSSVEYLEWGTGGSTYQFYDQVKHMTSIENNEEWCNIMLNTSHVKCGQSTGQLDYFCPMRNALSGPYGVPLYDSIISSHAEGNHTGFFNYHKYVNILDYLPNEYYDVILVDGRFRVACALKALAYVRPKTGVLAIHDYQRPWYHVVEKYYDKIEEVVGHETFAVFKPKPDLLEAQYDDYLEYLKDWR